jgi:hypothetical protein
MAQFDQSIEWLGKQMANATEALADLKSGRKIEFNGKDVTQELITRYEQLVAQYKRIISAYQAHKQ